MSYDSDKHKKLREIIINFSLSRRAVLQLFLKNYDDEEISSSLKIKKSNVRQHIRRAAIKLNIAPHNEIYQGYRRKQLVRLFRELQIPDYSVAQLHYCCEGESLQVENSVTQEEKSSGLLDFREVNFVGREEAITRIDKYQQQNIKVLQILGIGGLGKTTLAREYLKNRFPSLPFFECTIARRSTDIMSVENLLERIFSKLNIQSGRDFRSSLERLRKKLKSTKIGILLDNIEPALNDRGCFEPSCEKYIELLDLLNEADLKSFTLITGRAPINEPSLTIEEYSLESLNLQAWKEYFIAEYVQLTECQQILQEIHKAFGGNAKAMDIISKVIRQDYKGNIEIYWQNNKDCLLVEQKLSNLIQEQFKRLLELKRFDAYNLLCRLGCYRYQDVPRIPEQGLRALLWDVDLKKQPRTIRFLKDRGLIEVEEHNYWLHPVICEESTQRLKESGEWEKSNIKAAHFWETFVEEIKSKDDIYFAFEACFHLQNINDYNGIVRTIFDYFRNTISSYENFKNGMNLFDNIRRYGLQAKFKQIEDFFTSQNSSNISQELNTLLLFGINCIKWFFGDIHLAIRGYNERLNLVPNKYTRKIDNYSIEEYIYHREGYLGTQTSLGYCYLNLWDFQKARKYFEHLLDICNEDEKEFNFLVEANVACALIDSYEDANKNRENILKRLAYVFHPDVIDYQSINFYCTAYRYIFSAITHKNLGDYQTANNLLEKFFGLTQGEFKNYVYKQSEGYAYTIKASISRDIGNQEVALTFHEKSIQILKDISSMCDLAEAYFQCALTYQEMEHRQESQYYFEEALNLWSPKQINAPQQIERVRKAMNQ